MKCPHCLVQINPNFSEHLIGKDRSGHWSVFRMICPNEACNNMIIDVAVGILHKSATGADMSSLQRIAHRQTVHPFSSSRRPVPKEVDVLFATDYTEACLILNLSPKASAALSRRCLQNVLRERARVKKGDLATEIQQAIDSKTLPSHLAESIDAVRNIGNFAAHPLKSTATGEIVEVEVGEAEWLLDVLEALFDFYFVQPAILKAKRELLNKKLADIGKPPMK